MAVKVTAYAWDKIPSAITKLEKDATSVRNRLHSIGVSILKHYHDNPDDYLEVGKRLTALVAASPYHARAVSVWVQLFTPFRVSEENKSFFCHKDDRLNGKSYLKDGKKIEQVSLSADKRQAVGFIAARENPFWEVSPPQEVKPIDDVKELESFIERMENRAKKALEGDALHPAMLRELKDVLKRFKDASDTRTSDNVAH